MSIDPKVAEMYSPELVKDFPLMWKVYDHISEHPQEWRQGTWAVHVEGPNYCGTAFCFAGHVTHIACPDFVPVFEKETARVVVTGMLMDSLGNKVWIEDKAMEVLGIDGTEADELFDGTNTLPQIRDIIAGWEADEAV